MKICQNYTFLALLPLFLLGCGNFNSVHRVLHVAHGEGALIDIKQRAIFSAVVPTRDKHGNVIKQLRVCAEPSPDALSAYAAELVGKVDSGKIAGELAAAFQEGSSFVGLRTQSIQLMRDASYRLCEGYMSGAIDADEYAWLIRRFQRSMVVLLAVEQLTGTVRMPTVTITTQGQAEAAKSISEIRKAKEKIDDRITELESKEQTDKTKEELAALKEDSQLMEKAISNARGLLAGGSTAASYDKDTNQSRTPSSSEIGAVAKIVQEMVESVTSGVDDRGGLCFHYFRSLASNEQANETIKDLCEEYFLSGGGITRQAKSKTEILVKPPFLINENKKGK